MLFTTLRKNSAQVRFFHGPIYLGSLILDVSVADHCLSFGVDINPNTWTREGFAGSDVCDLPIDEGNLIKREHCSALSVKRFINEYERPYIPVVIDGIPEMENWDALKHWTLKQLRRDYKHAELKCGEADDGKSIRMKFKYFLKYLKLQTDDSPLYIFDSTFDDHKDTKPLLDDYRVPKYFPEDLFSLSTLR